MPLKKDQSLKHVIQCFLRTPAGEATPAQIRRTLRVLGEELEKNAMLREKYNLLVQKYDQAESAASNASPDTGPLLGQEFDKRANEFEAWERDLVASDYRVVDMEENLADQRALFAQSELLRFKSRGHAHNPKVFANALAGLPTIGARRSFWLCSQKPSPLWPSHHFQIFSFIEGTWKNRARDSDQTIEQQFRNAVLRLPKTVAVERPVIDRYDLNFRTRENYLRDFLATNWRYLRLAVNRVTRHWKLSASVVPYLVVQQFFKNLGRARTPEEEVLADIEMIRD